MLASRSCQRRSVPTVVTTSSAGERATLEAFLDDYREIVVRKVSGLSDADCPAPARPVIERSVGGLVKHLRWAEYGWFEQLLQERSDNNRRAHERSWEFVFLPDESLPTLLDDYQAQCDESRRIAARVSARPRGAAPSFRLGLAALDLRAHDRGDCPAHRTTRHPARTNWTAQRDSTAEPPAG